jgi:hypothetical protein
LRLMIPLLHLTILFANLSLAGGGPYDWLLAGQIGLYAAALGGCMQRGQGRRFIGFTVAYTLCLLCWATIAGFYRFITHGQPVTWERTPITLPQRAEHAGRATGIAA